MMKTKLFLLLAVLFLSYSVPCLAQSDDNLPWKTEEEYRNAEPEILTYISWLNTHFEKDDEASRKLKSATVFAWVSGSPYISMNLNMLYSDMAGEKDKHLAEYLLAYICGKTQYLIKYQKEPAEAEANLNAAKSVLTWYKGFLAKDKKRKNKGLESLSAMNDTELRAYVDKHSGVK